MLNPTPKALRAPFEPQAETGQRDYDDVDWPLFRRKKADRRNLPSNTGCLLFTQRRGL